MAPGDFGRGCTNGIVGIAYTSSFVVLLGCLLQPYLSGLGYSSSCPLHGVVASAFRNLDNKRERVRARVCLGRASVDNRLLCALVWWVGHVKDAVGTPCRASCGLTTHGLGLGFTSVPASLVASSTRCSRRCCAHDHRDTDRVHERWWGCWWVAGDWVDVAGSWAVHPPDAWW